MIGLNTAKAKKTSFLCSTMLLNAVYAYQFNVKATGSFVSNMYANDVETKDASYTQCASRFADEIA